MEITQYHSMKRQCSQAVIVLLAGMMMAGCQGLSSGGSSNSQPPQGNSLAFSSASLNFGNVVVGGSNTLNVTATNNGSGAVTIASASSSAKQFALETPGLPITIPAGQSATLSVVFTPDSSTTDNGTLSLVSSADNSPTALSLAGVGVPPGQLTASPTSLGFGSIVLGNSQSKQVALTNTGDSSITISQASISGTGFGMTGMNLPLTLSPGQSTNVNVSFKPQASGVATGSVVLTTSASMSAKHARLVRASLKFGESHAMAVGDGTFTIELSGDGQQPGILSVSPASLAFVNVEVNNNHSQPATLTNTGGTTLTVSQATVTGAGFSVSGLVLPLSLGAGQSANFSVIFAPQAAGNVSGNVAFTSDASNPTLNLPLSGQALAQGSLTVSPTSIAFGNVVTGTNSQQPATLTNTGGSSVTITQAIASGTGYSVSGLNLPVTLAAGQSTGLTVTFAPQSTGTINGNVTFTSNAPDPTLVLPLTGTGVSLGTLTPNPTSLSFGSVQVGNNKQLQESVKNTGGSNLTITQIRFPGARSASVD